MTASDRHLAQTVIGPVEPGQLGITLPHEHLLVDLVLPYFTEPDSDDERRLARQPVTLARHEEMIVDCNRSTDNLRLDDAAVISEELKAFQLLGGATVVELTSVDIGRDPTGLRGIAKATGLNVVMGCGYYIGRSHPVDLEQRSVEEIADELERDVVEGVGETGIRAGIIGELGVDSLNASEQKVLQAGAAAQQRTGQRSMCMSNSFSAARGAACGQSTHSRRPVPT